MLVTGPLMFFWPAMPLQVYEASAEVVNSAGSQAAVQWFAALVTLMGWVEVRVAGRLTRAEVEAWAIADVLYVIGLYNFVRDCTPGWNFWSLVASAAFPVAWLPLRIAWLLAGGRWSDGDATKRRQ